jgi:hypothetical protein
MKPHYKTCSPLMNGWQRKTQASAFILQIFTVEDDIILMIMHRR